jgi:hypothetical protein
MNSQIKIEDNHTFTPFPTLISAIRTLYQNHLKAGCEQLFNLNRILLKAERKQRMRQTLYRLGWVSGLSILVLALSYLTVGVNFVTAIGLLVAYFVGLIMHSKYSPSPVKHKEEHELLELNNKLRREIVAVESEHGNVLCALLEATDLMQLAKKNGFTLDSGNPAAKDDSVLIDDYQVDGNGLYQYLDAVNLLMENEDKLEAL